MAYTFFELEQEGHVATLWLNNPDKRNAMNPDFWRELPVAMQALGADENVRAVVIAARGPHFTAGLDLKSMGGSISGDAEEKTSEVVRRLQLLGSIRGFQAAITSIADCPKPRETRIAIVADVGTLQRLPGIVGRGIAAELALTGDDFGAERAQEINLVNGVLADASSTVKGAQAMAARMAHNSPLAVQGTKQVLRYCEGKSVEDGLEYVATWNAGFLQSDDLREAMLAFLQKREAKFEGK